MLLNSHKFIIEGCSEMKQTRNNFQYIEVILRKPAPRDEFQDRVFDDDILQCTAWGKSAQEMPYLQSGDKVECQLALKGSKHFSNDGKGTIFYRHQLTIRKIEKL